MIFDDLKELERLYEEGTIPEPEELEGDFYVVVPWFPWISFELFKHHKSADSSGEGDNVMLDSIRFGHFVLDKQADSLLINYDLPENSFIMRGVVDKVRRLADGRIIGKLYYKILGQEVFIEYFEMRKKTD